MARFMPLLSGLNFPGLVQAFDFASETPVRQHSGLGTAKLSLLDHPDVPIGSEFRKPGRFQNPKPSWPALCGPSTSLRHGRQERKTPAFAGAGVDDPPKKFEGGPGHDGL
jgi:hypothetical protein